MSVQKEPSLLYYLPLCQLFEDKLGEFVESILPDYKIVLTVRILDQSAGNSVLVAESLELCAVADQTVTAAAYHPQKLVLLLDLLNIRNELSCTLSVGS